MPPYFLSSNPLKFDGFRQKIRDIIKQKTEKNYAEVKQKTNIELFD